MSPGYKKGVPIGVALDRFGSSKIVDGGTSPSDETGESGPDE